METLDDWLAQRPGAPARGTRAFKRYAGQLYNAWLAYVRERHGGDLPPSPKAIGRAEPVPMFCAYCEAPMPLMPNEVRKGRMYCSPKCSNRSRTLPHGPYEDIEKRNRQIMRMLEGNMAHSEIAAYFGLATSTIRTIKHRWDS